MAGPDLHISKRDYGLLKAITAILFILTVSANGQVEIIYPNESDTLLTGRNYHLQWAMPTDWQSNIMFSTDEGQVWEPLLLNTSLTETDFKIPIMQPLSLWLRNNAYHMIDVVLLREYLDRHPGYINALDISPDGRYMLSGGRGGRVVISNIEFGGQVGVIDMPGPVSVFDVSYYHNGDTVIIAADNTAFIWLPATGYLEEIPNAASDDYIRSVCPIPGKDKIVIAHDNNEIRFISLNASEYGSVETVQIPGAGHIYKMEISPTGNLLGIGDSDGYIHVYDIAEQSFVFSSQIHSQMIWAASISPDDRYIATGGVDKTVQVWDIETQSIVHKFEGHTGHVRSVAFSPDGKYLISGSLDNTFRQWDLARTAQIGRSVDHGGAVQAAIYSQTGDSIFSAGRDLDIRLWKNFEMESDNDTVKCTVKYPALAMVGDYQLMAGTQQPFAVESVLEPGIPDADPYMADIVLEIPGELLHANNIASMAGPDMRDTITLRAEVNTLNGTMATFTGLALVSDNAAGEIRILGIKPDTNEDYYFEYNDGSISVLNRCVGKSGRAVSFSASPLGLTVAPNPVSSHARAEISAVEEGRYELSLLNESGQKLRKITDMNLKIGNYTYFFDSADLPAGTYTLVLRSPSDFRAVGFVIIK